MNESYLHLANDYERRQDQIAKRWYHAELDDLMIKHDIDHLGYDELKACFFEEDEEKAQELLEFLGEMAQWAAECAMECSDYEE